VSKKIICGLLVVVFVVLLKSYGYTAENIYGNTVGNISNWGYAAIQNDWIYYHNGSDDGKLYKIRIYGGQRVN
jgi:hypothetical protein